jgi:hypothetical protein
MIASIIAASRLVPTTSSDFAGTEDMVATMPISHRESTSRSD